jgi:hypothetical protein
VPIHRRTVGEAFVGREDAGIFQILRDEEAYRVRLVGANVVGHFEQGTAQGYLLALLGTDDGGDREHSGPQSTRGFRRYNDASLLLGSRAWKA